MSAELAPNPQEVREQWLAARIAEFQADPAMRDRAIASILFTMLSVEEAMVELKAQVQKEGLGGLFKALRGMLG